MDEARPRIFISTVASELKSAREKVADTLRRLYFQPVIQVEFSAHSGCVRAMLEKELAPCAAVIQIVGHRYGWEIFGAADPTEVMSHTQYVASYAHRKPIPVWYLIITDNYPVDAPNDEEEKKKLYQSAYRLRVQSTGHLFHCVADLKDVELTIFRMWQDLDLLRPPLFRQFPLLESAGGPVDPPPATALPPAPDPAVLEELMRAVLSDFVPALQQTRHTGSPWDDDSAEDELYARLAKILHQTPAGARAEIQSLAKKTKTDPAQPLLERVKAAYALKDYPAAEELALQAAALAAAAAPPDLAAHLAALGQAGEAASRQTQYKRALDHYRAAATLTSEARDTLEWVGIQNEIGVLLYLDCPEEPNHGTHRFVERPGF